MWSQKEMRVLSKINRQINAFSTDKDDEFTVIRENGKKQGIFKTWAIPIIPFLDFGKTEILDSLWSRLVVLASKTDFESALKELSRSSNKNTRRLANEVLKMLHSWTEFCRKYPSYMERSLERARLYSWIVDKKLTNIFRAEPLSNKPQIRINQLVNRLHLVFGLMAPFYNLEALIALPESHCRYPGIKKETGQKPVTGKLDVVPFLLPAAFRDYIITETLDWKNLNWKILKRLTKEALGDRRKKKILLNISRLAGIPVHHVLFIANALEWIPKRVGGKKGDPISTEEALNQLERIISKDELEKDGIAVLSQINALIRFLNWTPLIENEENFKGRFWTYSSVCDITEDLLDVLDRHPELWQDGFVETFKNILRPQLDNLDASSAKGRFFLHLILKENRLKKKIWLNKKWQKKIIEQVVKPDLLEFRGLSEFYPLSLTGGKPFGLALAGTVLGEKLIPKGFIISTSTVEFFLKENRELWQKIIELNKEINLEKKLLLAKKVEQTILKMSLPQWLDDLISQGLDGFSGINLWAIRSSSLDEGTARGVHKTFLRVGRKRCRVAVKKCIASYYSREAVLFRKINGTGDLPCIAVFLIPYLRGKGGVASRLWRGETWKETISVGSTPAMVTAGHAGVQEIINKDDNLQPTEAEVVKLLRDIGNIFDQIQIEWIVQKSGIQILQMEILPIKAEKERIEKDIPTIKVEINSKQDFSNLENILRNRQEKVLLQIGKAINPSTFQGELFTAIAQYGKRIKEIHLDQEISPSSHFANICYFFGIKIRFHKK